MRTATVICIFVSLIALAGCAEDASPQLASCPLKSATSPYTIDACWQTDTGKDIHLTDLRGKPRVLGMVFTSCQGTCLVTLDSLKQIEASLSPSQRSKIGFVVVTLDPANDTADALATYRRANQLADDRWTLLRGDPAATARLATALGITFNHQSPRGLVHSSGITIVDANGQIIHQQLGLHPDLTAAVSAIQAEEAASKPNAVANSGS